MLKMKISPKFSTKQIIDETLRRDWFIFQAEAYELGNIILQYMQSYINSHRQRQGNTGNLANVMTFRGFSGTGFISWGIGDISLLNSKAPYWYVINFGKKITGEAFIPGGGGFVPGYFGQGNRPDPAMKGKGTESFSYAPRIKMGMYPGVIRPINYIEATRHKLDSEINKLLLKLKGGM